ncbi:MAG: HD domain-containing protein [Ruminococcaceae bacterium]|nr:HD domain-containing protein [Oscillospiraceae bacterium]
MTDRERFIEIYKKNIKREGADRLLEYLCSDACDFFTAPASTRYHGAYAGGLLEHSLNVYDCLCDYLSRSRAKEKYGMNYSDETVAIVALLHDLCKVNFYVETTRNVKENGVWKTVPYYSIEDKLPYGHGEKSVYIVSGYMRLTRDEAFAIRYHMGFAGAESVNAIGNIGKAFEMFPIAFALSVADMEASYYIEGMPKN